MMGPLPRSRWTTLELPEVPPAAAPAAAAARCCVLCSCFWTCWTSSERLLLALLWGSLFGRSAPGRPPKLPLLAENYKEGKGTSARLIKKVGVEG